MKKNERPPEMQLFLIITEYYLKRKAPSLWLSLMKNWISKKNK